MNLRLAHIINPVRVETKSDLHFAQPITFESMLRARSFSKYKDDILLFAICYEEDREIVPPEFTLLPNLSRSVLDFGQFAATRKLPLIRDILDPLRQFKDVDYVIYTNVDIALMPYFYDFVLDKLAGGIDCVVINRRTVTWGGSLAQTYSLLGKKHPGFDCFVFKRTLLDVANFGTACIGANWIGRVLLSNMIMYCNEIEIVRDSHLTFHLGEDGAWLSGKYGDYDNHNMAEATTIIRKFLTETDNADKRTQLKEILEYMTNWRSGARSTPPSTTTGILQRVKQSIFKFLR